MKNKIDDAGKREKMTRSVSGRRDYKPGRLGGEAAVAGRVTSERKVQCVCTPCEVLLWSCVALRDGTSDGSNRSRRESAAAGRPGRAGLSEPRG